MTVAVNGLVAQRLVALPSDCQYVQPVPDQHPHGGLSAFTHLARVNIRGIEARAYVKAYDRRSTAKTLGEVIGYTLGSHAELPQPAMAALVAVPGVVLRQKAVGMHRADGTALEFDDQHICFATLEVVGYEGGRVRSFAAVNGWSDSRIARDELECILFPWAEKWPHFGRLAAFDAWVANVDRNLGNVLWISDKQFLVIDHGELFAGLAAPVDGNDSWPAVETHTGQMFPHKLMDTLIQLRPDLSPKIIVDTVAGCVRMTHAYAAARDELNYWLSGNSDAVRFRAHRWLWKRLDDENLVRVVNRLMGQLV